MDCENQKLSCVTKYMMPFIIAMGILIGLVGIALIVVFFGVEEEEIVGKGIMKYNINAIFYYYYNYIY